MFLRALTSWSLQLFFQEEQRAPFGYSRQFSKHTIAKSFVKGPRLKTGGLKIREQMPLISSVVFNRGQQRGAISFSTVVFGDPHPGDVHRGAPEVTLRTADDAPVFIFQKARHRARRLVPDESAVEGADSINDLPQLLRRRMLVLIGE